MLCAAILMPMMLVDAGAAVRTFSAGPGPHFRINGESTFLIGNREGFVGGDWNHEYWNQYDPELDYGEYIARMVDAGINWVRANGISMAEGAGRVHAANTRPDAPNYPPKPPFTRRPWLRTGPGVAWDGLPKYDLTRFDPRYFERLTDFVDQCNASGIVVEFILFHQHNIYQIPDHYADNPFRPENNINDVELPTGQPTAYPDFYDETKTRLRGLQIAYVDRVLEAIGGRAVIFTIADEYNWTAEWIRGWARHIREFGRARGLDLVVQLGAAHEPTMTLAAVGGVDSFDLSHYAITPQGAVHSVPIREHTRLSNALSDADFELETEHSTLLAMVQGPGRPCVREGRADRQAFWTALVSGAAGFYYHGFWQYGGEASTNRSIRRVLERLGDLSGLAPHDDLVDSEQGRAWALAEPGKRYLVYVEGTEAITLRTGGAQGLVAQWFDPRGSTFGPETEVGVDPGVRLPVPDRQDWVLLVRPGR
ncbi:MAG TPA: DUF6298 domain-containing protein [Armatimonadota bacterium]|nr:DUF6298 domain-containing protein [Armatimonadota bacterium]